MTDPPVDHALLIMLIGGTVVAATLLRAWFERFRLPAVVGYLLLGIALSAMDSRFGWLSPATREAFALLAEAGVVALLFRVGLESNPGKLARQLPRAGMVLVGSVVPSGVLGYLAARYILGIDPLPALFAATALTATSLGVALAEWRDAGLIDSDNGALLVDVAELDDIVAIFLMALLLTTVAALFEGNEETLSRLLGLTAAWLAAKLTILVALCVLLARYVERPVTRWFGRMEPSPELMLLVAGFGFVVAALAGWLGFSLAVGALFAGLTFSRDPERVRIDRAFGTLFNFFTPFFFVGIGLSVDLDSLAPSVGAGLVLLAVAVVGKVAGTGLPVLIASDRGSALLIGVSMVPRAEIAMVVMQQAGLLGAGAVPPELFGGMVFVALATCVLTPPAVRALLGRYPQRPGTTG